MSKKPPTRKYQVDFNYGGGSHAFEYVPGHWDLQAVKAEVVRFIPLRPYRLVNVAVYYYDRVGPQRWERQQGQLMFFSKADVMQLRHPGSSNRVPWWER